MGNLESVFATEQHGAGELQDTAGWRWYVARTEPSHERQALDGLMGKRQYGTINNVRVPLAQRTPAYYTTREGKRIESDAEFKVYLPEIPRRRLAGRKMREILVPMIPGYLFIQCDLTGEMFNRVRSTPGILETRPFLGHDGTPCQVPAAAIEIIRRVECKQKEEPPAPFSVGQLVFVNLTGQEFGADEFAGIIEDVAQLVSRGRVKVAIQMFRRWTPLDVDIANIRAA